MVSATAVEAGSATPRTTANAARVASSRRVRGRRGTGEPEGGEVTVIRASVQEGASYRVESRTRPFTPADSLAQTVEWTGAP